MPRAVSAAAALLLLLALECQPRAASGQQEALPACHPKAEGGADTALVDDAVTAVVETVSSQIMDNPAFVLPVGGGAYITYRIRLQLSEQVVSVYTIFGKLQPLPLRLL